MVISYTGRLFMTSYKCDGHKRSFMQRYFVAFQWTLVCSDAHLVANANSFCWIGHIFGLIVGGHVADRCTFFKTFLLHQGPFCGATDYPYFGLCVTLPIGYKATVVLLLAL